MDIFIKGKQFFSMNNRIQDQAISQEADQKMEQPANSNDLHENSMMDDSHASLYQQNFITHIIKQPTNEQLSILNTLNTNPTNPQQDSQISQKQLREKLILMFKKDKQKNYQICDYFMKDLGLAEHFENVKKFIEFIQRNQQDNLSKGGNDNFNGNQSTNSQLERQFTQQKPSNIPTPNLSIFSTKSTFIASTFSRDKVRILLQLHSTNHKIINFLNFLLVSLRSYIFTNQKQWILMKDQIQRYLSKYEKNVQKIYEVDEQLQQQEEVENCDVNEGKKLPLQITKAHAKLQKTKQIKKISSQLRKKYTKRFTLQNYKSQTSKVRQKLTQHQQSMCSALRKSCYSIYERFEHIVEELKDEMLFVIAWLEKAERFNQSKEKYLIKQFLLESRRIGVQGLIYLQLIYKNIIERVETTRRKILYEIQQTVNNKKSHMSIFIQNRLQQQHNNNNNRDYHSKSKKQMAFVRQVSVIFHNLQRTLMVKKIKENVHVINNEVRSDKIRRSSLLFNQREVVVEVDGDDDDDQSINASNASSSKSQSESRVQKIKSFQVLVEKDIQKKGEQKFNHQIKSLILPSPLPQQVIEESQNQKFISAIFGDRKCSQQIKKVQQQKQRLRQKGQQKEETKKKDALLDGKKKKKIRKVNKVAKNSDGMKDLKKPVNKKMFQRDSKRVKKENEHKRTGLKNLATNYNYQILPPIVSQDQPNKSQSSSSLQYLSHAFINPQTTFTSPKKSTTKLEEQIKNPANYSSMKKSNQQNHYEQFQSLSIEIPLCIQYESGQINMDDFDQVSQQMSSFYNDVIEDSNKDCGGKRE